MFGVGNDGKKYEEAQRVGPPEDARGRGVIGSVKRGQVGDHQPEDQQGDEA